MGNTPREPKVGPKVRPTGGYCLVAELIRFEVNGPNSDDYSDHRSKDKAARFTNQAKLKQRWDNRNDMATRRTEDAGHVFPWVHHSIYHMILLPRMDSFIPKSVDARL